MNRIGIIDSSLGSPSIEKSGEKKQWRPVKPLSYGLLCSFLACWIVLSVSCAPRVSQNEIIGIASWYGKDYHGKRTASGEWYNMYKYTAAHPTLPFGTRVEVTNLDTNRRVVVVI
ncbi:septal ring lytic transglycosylase RlpA family protein, partial [bacterium]|nr:septal ring lytic transglycosylase RlpA family protein [candidate division CSSED10-310 bacterium]